MTTPEARARQNIDAQLTACGWLVQDRSAMNLLAGRGVAVREFPLKTGYADYLLFVDRGAAGIVEAKPEGMPLAGVAEQAATYAVGLPDHIPHVTLPLPFLYESTGVETFFRDNRDPEPRSRRVFAFHRPEMLADWLSQPDTLRARLRVLPEIYPLITNNLWSAQVEAINNLEQSFATDRPRALIQMATGSGKTFTAVNFVYRLIKHAKARRVLFLVDRNNLGRQAFKEFDQFVTPDDGRKFSELYNVQHLQSNVLDDVSKVHITTIQRLYSMLSGEAEFDPANEEISLWEAEGALHGQPEKEARYNARLPVEYYDFIIADECHRSIYNLWRQVLEYFDAYLIGLTATPSKQTFGFFKQNLVMEYSRQRAVADGVNVDGEVYRIRTRISEQGSTIEKGWWVGRRDKRTRRQRWEQLEEDFSYDPEELDRRVTSPDQIRTIINAYRDSLPELFPGRKEAPKTLIFAKDDNHAEEIVRITREVFGKGDDFCQKITYRSTGLPENLISAFRTSYNPRIAVTVDMIATGTDIRPLEALLFMRAVRSRVLFEQMLGRGTRVISETDFQSVTTTPNALKTRFVIVDAVGVTEQELIDTGTVERKRSVPLKNLLDAVAVGAVDDDLLASLARRLGMLEKRLSVAQHQEVKNLLDVPSAPERFTNLRQLSNASLDALDTDRIQAQALQDGANPITGPTDQEMEAARQQLIARAVIPLAASPDLRRYLLEREILIDETSEDTLLAVGFDADATAHARQLVESFQQFIQEHKDEITALQILFSRPYAQRHLDFVQVRELAEQLDQHLHQSDPLLLTEALWRAYMQLEKDRVRGAGERRILADLVSLVRHAALDEELLPYPERVQWRYQDWLAIQSASGREFTPQQRWWLDEIARHIGINVSISLDDLNSYGFQMRGGQVAAQRLFGVELGALLDELNMALGG
jgi:type I restriction enzyme R subunit